MDYSKTTFQIVYGDLAELREQAKSMTARELAETNNVSYSKMTSILRLSGIKAKKPVRPPRPRKAKDNKPKKDHEIAHWASSYNEGKIRYVYYDMLRRCYKPEDRGYYRYGARGITVCEEWRNDCCAFYRWARDNGYRKGLQLDRIDNDKGYSPENCRFVTPMENTMNRSCTRRVRYKGEEHTVKEWARITGLSYQVLADRLYRYGWSVEKALTTDKLR